MFRTYVFNVCANAVTPDACAVTRGDLGEELSGPSPAFEVFATEFAYGGTETGKYGGDPNALCMRLGDSVFDSKGAHSGAELSLIDSSNPAKGVRARTLYHTVFIIISSHISGVFLCCFGFDEQ